MQKLEVGKPFVEGVTRYPDGCRFYYDKGGPMLILFASRLKDSEIEAVKKGQIELALYENQPAVFLLYRIRGFCPWSDAPYTIHLVKEENRPDIEGMRLVKEGQRLLLTIVLVDATTGIIKALRTVSTSTKFTVLLNQAVCRQLDQPFDHVEYNRHIDVLYQRYTSEHMLAMAEAKHKAGE